MADLWSAHEPLETELGERAERALRFAFWSDVWVENARHPPSKCPCYLLPIWLNHAAHDARTGKICPCVGCVKLRKLWR